MGHQTECDVGVQAHVQGEHQRQAALLLGLEQQARSLASLAAEHCLSASSCAAQGGKHAERELAAELPPSEFGASPSRILQDAGIVVPLECMDVCWPRSMPSRS